ncbi:MAG: acyl carrier protein [Kiritimatiellae bacterium]|nr:acyl carrier protein [Kiritimatiellia bacterium]
MHSYDEIYKTISEILVSDFEIKPEQIKPEVKLFEDLDLDSIDAVDLIVRLQKIIKRKVNADDFKQIRTLDDVVKVVERLVNAPE